MLRSRVRRLFSGLFAIWFTALGLTRGTYMACLDHRAEHQAQASVVSVTSPAAAVAATPPDLHAGHGAHATHAGAASADTRTSAGADVGQGAPESPDHCTCAGDCCCAVPAQALPRTQIACAPDARVAPELPDIAQTARPSEYIAHVLPFATAPPATPLIA